MSKESLSDKQLTELAEDSEWILAGRHGWTKSAIRDLVAEVRSQRQEIKQLKERLGESNE